MISHIMRAALVATLVLIASISLQAQTKTEEKAHAQPAPIVAPPSAQKEFKALVDVRNKAQAEYNAAIEHLPEFASAKAAQKALEDAAAKLPSALAWKAADDAVKDKAYAAMAETKLSSREYEPQIDPKSQELIFVKTKP